MTTFSVWACAVASAPNMSRKGRKVGSRVVIETHFSKFRPPARSLSLFSKSGLSYGAARPFAACVRAIRPFSINSQEHLSDEDPKELRALVRSNDGWRIRLRQLRGAYEHFGRCRGHDA